MKKILICLLTLFSVSSFADDLMTDICIETKGLEFITEPHEVRPATIRFITQDVKMDLVEYIKYKKELVSFLNKNCDLHLNGGNLDRINRSDNRRKILYAIGAFITLSPETSVTSSENHRNFLFIADTERYKVLNPLRQRLMNKEEL